MAKACDPRRQNIILTAVSVVLVAMVGWAICSGYGSHREARPGPGIAESVPGPGGPAKPEGPPPSMGSPREPDPVGLLARASVRKELGLGAEQERAITAFQDAQRPGMAYGDQPMVAQPVAARGQAPVPPPDARSRKDTDAGVMALLTTRQRRRLRQLDLQERGPLAMADPALAHELGISEAHRGELSQIEGEMRQRMVEVAQQDVASDAHAVGRATVRGSRREQAIADDVRSASAWNALAVLSPEERASWSRAIGAPFTFGKDEPAKREAGGWEGPGGPGGFGGPF